MNEREAINPAVIDLFDSRRGDRRMMLTGQQKDALSPRSYYLSGSSSCLSRKPLTAPSHQLIVPADN